MSNTIHEFYGSIEKALVSAEGMKQLSPEFKGAMKKIGGCVESFLTDNNLASFVDVEGTGAQVMAANESFKCEEIPTQIGAEKIITLCRDAGVATEHLEAASKRVAALLFTMVGRKGNGAVLAYRTTNLNGQTAASIESLYPASLATTIKGDGALESFGINIDRVQPDLKTVITIALLQFHTNLTPRIVPVQTTSQGNVTIVRESMEVFDMSEKEQKPVRLIELYRDPAMVSVRAMRIVPLKANDTDDRCLLADGIYKFFQDFNIFSLAVDQTRAGYEKFNHTDLVEDGILLDKVLVKITAASSLDGSATGSTYVMADIPVGRGRLTQISNDLRSTDRRLSLDRFSIVINKDTAIFDKLPAYVPTANVLAGLKDGLTLRIGLRASVHVDRKTSNGDASCWAGSLALVRADGQELTDAQKLWINGQAASGDDPAIDGLKVEFLGFMLDARYNEDNKRKTSIRAEINRRSMSYELPTGRNFVVDTAIGQDGSSTAAARLAQLEHIGRDYNNLEIINEVMKSVHDQIVTMNNDRESQMQLAATYAAGDQVNPYVFMDTFDMTGMYGMRSADASGDIKQYVKQYLNVVTSGILARSLFQQQLASGAKVVFRVITSPEILGNLFMAKHIHQHLNNDEEGTAGVEHVVVLDNGVRLEVVTTTFKSMESKMILLPYLANSQASVLNFGTDYDQGTLVGSFSIGTDGGASFHRMFSTTRELLIPTNVMGASIDVTGTASVNMTGNTGTISLNVGDEAGSL